MKPFLLILGFLAALLLISQLVMGLLIASGSVNLIKSHRHSGYAAVAVSLLYIVLTLVRIASTPARPSV